MQILWAIVVALLILWLIGAVINVVGALIHLVLVAALIVLVYAIIRRAR